MATNSKHFFINSNEYYLIYNIPLVYSQAIMRVKIYYQKSLGPDTSHHLEFRIIIWCIFHILHDTPHRVCERNP